MAARKNAAGAETVRPSVKPWEFDPSLPRYDFSGGVPAEEELALAERDIANGDCLTLSAEEAERWMETGDLPWLDEA